MKIASTLVIALPLVAACSAAPPDSGEDATATTAEAITTGADPCAVGTTANATVDLTEAHAQDHYLRPASYINSSCPAHGKDRPMTIVDIEIGPDKAGNSWPVFAEGLFPTVTRQDDCEAMELDAQLFFYVGDHVWKGVTHQIHHGHWVQDTIFSAHCDPPETAGFTILNPDSSRFRWHATGTVTRFETVDNHISFVGIEIGGRHDLPRP